MAGVTVNLTIQLKSRTMKKYSMMTAGVATLMCATMVMSPSSADDDVKVKNQTRNNRSQAGSLDDKTSGSAIRVSQLLGMNIQNSKGEGVGEINDIVLDANTGRVKYAAVTYGGLLGVGNKMFAVPFEAFKCQQDPDDRDEHVMVLNVTQKQLEGQTGFDEDHWPNFADRKFTADLDKRYGVERKMRNRDRLRNRDGDKDVDVKVGKDGVDVDVDDKPDRDDK